MERVLTNKNGRVFVCGDTHGDEFDTSKLSKRKFRVQKELTKDDVMIQLGDFGWVYYPFGENKEQEYWLDVLAGRSYTLAVVLGNHENYDLIETLPIEMKWGNEVRVLYRKTGNIYFLKRGGVYEINGRKILVIGGAESTDRGTRNEGISWWRQECLSYAETESCLDEIEIHGDTYDYVLSHTCPESIIYRLVGGKFLDRKCSVASFLQHIDGIVKCKEWHFGHFHKDDIVIDGKYRCHYRGHPLELD